MDISGSYGEIGLSRTSGCAGSVGGFGSITSLSEIGCISSKPGMMRYSSQIRSGDGGSIGATSSVRSTSIGVAATVKLFS